jgi:AraC-like DNA-binding protein
VREGLLLGRFLLPIVAVARRYGLDDATLHRLDLDPARLAALETMVPSPRIYALLEELAPRVELEPFAIAVAEATTASDMGPIGLALRAAPTGRQALTLLVRYQKVVNTVAGFHLLEGDGEVALAEDRCGPDGLGRAIAAEITAMTNVHWARLLLGREATPRRIALPRPGKRAVYEAWAACPVVTGAPHASVVFPTGPLERARPNADEELWQFFGELLAERAGQAPASPLVHRLRRELVGLLGEGAPSLPEMARRLGESPRTLQRKLHEAGERYSSVLDDLRHELALAHLSRAELGLAEIAFALGFDEVASFHRAFRRWEKTTPATFRARARG